MGIVNAVFRDIIDTTDCERCEAPAGENCNDMGRNPRLLGTPHVERHAEYVDRIGGLEELKRRIAATGPGVQRVYDKRRKP